MSEELVKEKDKALNKRVHNEDILRIDECVYRFINGNKKERYDAQAEILEYFNEYLEKYTNLFIGSQVDLNNYDTRNFIAMFLTGRPKTPVNLAAQRVYISNVMSRFTRDDIKNELTVLFLGVLHKYRIYPGVNALNPLTKFFRYRVKDWFNKIVKDALFRVDNLGQGGADNDVRNETLKNRGSREHYAPDPEEGELFSNFDLAWVRHPPQRLYQSLSTYERYLLFLIFNQDLGLAQVAERLERDKDTIKRHLTAILEKIEGKFENGSE